MLLEVSTSTARLARAGSERVHEIAGCSKTNTKTAHAANRSPASSIAQRAGTCLRSIVSVP